MSDLADKYELDVSDLEDAVAMVSKFRRYPSAAADDEEKALRNATPAVQSAPAHGSESILPPLYDATLVYVPCETT
jgi:hypothetical protein